MKSSASERIFFGIMRSILVILSIACVYPFIYMAALSFNEGVDTLKGGITLYPRAFTVGNYMSIISQTYLLSAYRVTILRTLIGTLGSVFITSLAAYGISDRSLPGRRFIMIYMLVPMFFSGGLIPYFLAVKSYGLLDTIWIYIIPGLFSVWNCIVMKTSFMSIPTSLKESVRIDGGNELQIYFHIIFPLSLPVFAAIALFVAVGHWNDWFTGAYFVSKNELKPVQTILQFIMNRTDIAKYFKEGQMISGSSNMANTIFNLSRTTAFSMKIAAVMIATIPILIIYPFLQKYFVKGVLIGSIKE